ncbi:hypothetical protein PYW07_000488 [Mythimna separata]|uniref:Uncharacterized protein n=1 Tax=Mythimna separata TaxID=271217 RepID=A0AAD8E1H9_MYTSE|nr:hypothetical protein PYW07_000488 [Mythimna separata]
MDYPKNRKFSSHLVLTAMLSAGITITLSVIYMLLSVMAIIFRFTDCSIPSTGSELFWALVTNVYIREGKNCAATDDITPAYTVFILAVITLTVSLLCLISASVLIATMKDEGMSRYLTMVVSAYIGLNVASLIVDLTTAAHFGIDHSTLSSNLDVAGNNTAYEAIYVLEVLRQGAFILMSVGLKGYVILVINWILIILLIIYLFEHRKLLKTADHSIHKMGALNAFDQPRRPDENNWATNNTPREPEIFSPFARGAQVNHAFNDADSDRGPRRSPMRSDTHYSNRSDDRSDSWHRGQPSLAQSSRPFSYLEDLKRPPVVPARPPPSPAVEPPWTHRDPWQQPQGPPVPAPDYSPQPRRLKSALKPGGQW